MGGFEKKEIEKKSTKLTSIAIAPLSIPYGILILPNCKKKIKVRLTEKKDIEERGLAKNTKGLVITKIANDSPINYLQEGNIIVEAQKKAIRTVADLETAVSKALNSNEKTLLLVIFNNQNQRRYIGVKLN